MVVTSLTRNQVVRKGTWVRIPPSPPLKNPVTMRVPGFFFFCARSKNHPILGCSFHHFGKNSFLLYAPLFFCVLLPSAAEIACFGKGRTAHHRLRRGEFRTVIQMGIDIRRGGKIRMSQPALNLLERYAVGKQEGRAAIHCRCAFRPKWVCCRHVGPSFEVGASWYTFDCEIGSSRYMAATLG